MCCVECRAVFLNPFFGKLLILVNFKNQITLKDSIKTLKNQAFFFHNEVTILALFLVTIFATESGTNSRN